MVPSQAGHCLLVQVTRGNSCGHLQKVTIKQKSDADDWLGCFHGATGWQRRVLRWNGRPSDSKEEGILACQVQCHSLRKLLPVVTCVVLPGSVAASRSAWRLMHTVSSHQVCFPSPAVTRCKREGLHLGGSQLESQVTGKEEALRSRD